MCSGCVERCPTACQTIGMRRDQSGGVGNVWWSVSVLALAACGGSNPSNPSEAPTTGGEPSGTAPVTSPTRSERLICPQCTHRAGGEASDVGENSVVTPGGEASSAPPDPCEQNAEHLRIDAASARALGFGPVLDRLS